MLEQLEERLDRLERAKEAYDLGLKHCPNSIPLWLSFANLEEKLNGVTVLTLAKNKNPQNPQLWLATVRAEMRHGNNKEVDILMVMALDKCPKSGILWAAYIESMAPLVFNGRTRLWMPSGNVITIPTSMGLWPSYSAIIVRTNENQKDVLRRCIAAQPKHCEKWQPISKALHNSHQPIEAILHQVVVELGKEKSSQ
ncbi:hypothetical protein CerSpe_161940 [Prunus speciosa]